MDIILLTSLDEIMTCYLSGHQLNEEIRRMCAAWADGTKRYDVKIVNEWPDSYNSAASDVKKAQTIAAIQADEDVVFMASLSPKRKQNNGELLWSSLS